MSYPGARATFPFRLDGDQLTRARQLPTGRHAVLAIGSNACPAQLSAKFAGRDCSPEVFGLVVRVGGLQIRPSAHLGRSGYWPFAPAALTTGSSTAVLTLLDDAQRAVLDATEPNYDRIPLDRSRHPVTDAPAELLQDGVELYASKHGVVDDARLPAWCDPPPTQVALLSALLPVLGAALPATVVDPVTLSAALRDDAGLAARLTGVLKRTMDVRPDGLR